MDNLRHKIHAKYFTRFLNLLPARMGSHDSTRVTLAFFSISGLDILDSIDLLSEKSKQQIIDWLYTLQVTPSPSDIQCGGFQVIQNHIK